MKPDAPQLFREWLGRKSWVCEPVNLLGITDPYQPAERKFEITPGCLKVASDANQPMYLITKNAMVTWTRSPAARLRAIEALAKRNIPVMANAP